MADATLLLFVKEALNSGASKADIDKALAEAGWPRHQISNALDMYSEVEFPVPVPVPKAHFSARDTFLYLVMFGMLYVSAYNLGSLLFQFVNLAFPDAAFEQYREYSGARIRFSISALIVAFPVFLLISTIIARQINREPAQRLSAIRRWLTYLTLAISSCVIAGDLIYLFNSFLSGELTMRFVLKVLIVGGISGGIFYYYLSEARNDDRILVR
jgi:hypothetical protein